MPNEINNARQTGGEFAPPDDVEPWIVCSVCGQRFDQRQLENMVHHAVTGHGPMAEADQPQPQSATNSFVDAFAHPAGPEDVSDDPPSALPRHI